MLLTFCKRYKFRNTLLGVSHMSELIRKYYISICVDITGTLTRVPKMQRGGIVLYDNGK